VLFLVDVSASGAFGSAEHSKLERLVEITALLMFAALKNNDKVGLAMFCDDVFEYLPPRKGKTHVLHMIRSLLSVRPIRRPTSLTGVLEFLNRVQKRRAVVFLISDFLADNAQHLLAITQKRHDITAIRVSDPREAYLPDVGFVSLMDAETGQIIELDTRHPALRDNYSQLGQNREQELSGMLRRIGVDQLQVDTQTDYTHSLRAFFKMRERRFR
jgi:uncharacterized protein (DUF58 family)